MYKKSVSGDTMVQSHLFNPLLKDIVNKSHALVLLADSICWSEFDEDLSTCFADTGRESLPGRLMLGLHYLKYTYDMSDEAVLEEWLENPYWQYFCGGTYFEHEFPIDSSSMTVWRRYLKKAGLEKMLAETIKVGLRTRLIKKSELKRVNVDTTVQEKNVRFPTDSRLYDRSRERLVSLAKERGLELRQTYERVSKKGLRKQSGYVKASQFKRAKKETKKLKTYLGRVIRDIKRKTEVIDLVLEQELFIAEKIFLQKKDDKNKVYSVHEPHVECIGKGKAHKKYEFGNKVGIVTSAKTNWILGTQAFHGNPYDGHTLKQCIEQAEQITETNFIQATCDLGYRKHNYDGTCTIQIVNRYRKKVPQAIKFWWKRRSAIEPVIGHVKNEHGMSKNRLKGQMGDEVNAVLSSCGYNMRKLLKAIFWRWIIFTLESLFHTIYVVNCGSQYKVQLRLVA
jgi:transposase, IS5 family